MDRLQIEQDRLYIGRAGKAGGRISRRMNRIGCFWIGCRTSRHACCIRSRIGSKISRK